MSLMAVHDAVNLIGCLWIVVLADESLNLCKELLVKGTPSRNEFLYETSWMR